MTDPMHCAKDGCKNQPSRQSYFCDEHYGQALVIKYLEPIQFNPDAVPKPAQMLTRAQMLEKYPK